jgi:hypothetical protein
MTTPIPPVELWSFRSFRASVTSTVDGEIVWDWLDDAEEALVIDVSYSTPPGTARHFIQIDWYDPTVTSGAARKVVAQTNDNAVFWNPVRWFVPRTPDSTRRWVLRADCSVPSGVEATLDVSVAIVRSSKTERT